MSAILEWIGAALRIGTRAWLSKYRYVYALYTFLDLWPLGPLYQLRCPLLA